jgi:CheY-like chemotaxis protein
MLPPPVLYAEDDENDVFLMERAFDKAQVINPLQTVIDGAAAIRYLAGTGEFADRQRFPFPCLVLLDLNLPRRSGLEVLKWIREQLSLQTLPVIMLTSSIQDRDIGAASALRANGYLVKPPSSERLLDLVTSLRDVCLAGEGSLHGWLDMKGNLLPPLAR